MVNTKDLIKIKEYDRFVLFKHKDTGIKECFLKIDIHPKKIKQKHGEIHGKEELCLTDKYKRKERCIWVS